MDIKENNKNIYFENLDLLRFIAAFMVVIVHAYGGWCSWWGYPRFMTQNGDTKTLNKVGNGIHHFLENGMFGVDIFFLISGFLITYILLVEKEKIGKIDIKKFFIRRGFRIWPLYFLIIAIAPFLVSWLNKPEPNYSAEFLFYNNFHSMYTGNWQYPFAHFWSICIEEHFYLVWPFLVAFIPNRYLLNVFWSVIFISIISRLGFNITEKGFYYMFLHTLSRMDVLAIGAIGAFMYHTNTLRFWIPKYARILLYFLFIIIFSSESHVIYDGIFLACFRKYFYVGIAAIAMLNFLFNPDSLFKIKSKNIFHYFGKISYGIYMFSNILIPVIIEKIIVPMNFINLYFYFFLNITLTLLLAIISYELFEKKILKLKSKFEVIKTRR